MIADRTKDDTPARGINIIIVYTGEVWNAALTAFSILSADGGYIYNGAIGAPISKVVQR